MKSWKHYELYEERLPNHVFVQRVADAAGVSAQSIHRAAKKRLMREGKRDRKRLKGCPYTFVSLSLWDEYMEVGSVKRVPVKPKNWLTAKALLEEGFSKRKLYQLVREGGIKAVYVGNTLYLDPETAKGYLETRHDLRPPPGWMCLSELREKTGRSKQALSTYLKRHQIETTQFLHPTRDQLVQYIRLEDAQKYLRCQHADHQLEEALPNAEQGCFQTAVKQANTDQPRAHEITASDLVNLPSSAQPAPDLHDKAKPPYTQELAPSSSPDLPKTDTHQSLISLAASKTTEQNLSLTQPVCYTQNLLTSGAYAAPTSTWGQQPNCAFDLCERWTLPMKPGVNLSDPYPGTSSSVLSARPVSLSCSLYHD